MRGDIRVMVATNAFGLGIDKPDIRFVLHYQLPPGLNAYYQEAGRAGRDGVTARCTLIYQHSDQRLRQFLQAGRYPTADDIAVGGDAYGGRLDHLVVLMFENRSFDNLLGYLYENESPKRFITRSLSDPAPSSPRPTTVRTRNPQTGACEGALHAPTRVDGRHHSTAMTPSLTRRPAC